MRHPCSPTSGPASRPVRGRGSNSKVGGIARVDGREEDLFRLRFETDVPVLEYLGRHGHMPLPPYIERPDEEADRERYQTVYARRPGAVAAPTAGLHFDAELLDASPRAV